jgi:serine/threonine-protein kinase HipA
MKMVMGLQKLDIYVFADWIGIAEPTLLGILSAHYGKGKKAFSFEYDKKWIQSKRNFVLDPDLQFFAGSQFPNQKENFGVFMDSMPDTWGRTLMRRRAALEGRENGQGIKKLYDIDFLLGVYDESRMGALRFKTVLDGPFLDNNKASATPPWASIRDLQYAALQIENDDDFLNMKKWLALLMAPGSSLGGARPKANVLDEKGCLWIAKFPSKNDNIDKAAWEFLAYQLAINAGIEMAPCRLEAIAGKYRTFFTQRFDRIKDARIHFASAMTMTGNTEEGLRDAPASYLDMAEFIQNNGVHIEHDLQQLWRRIVFNIAIANTDDHLRNHGFLLTEKGWRLSPAYDLNPSVEKDGLTLNIDTDLNALDFDLAKSVGEFFRLNENQMTAIIWDVQNSVKQWKRIAAEIGIPRSEQEMMQGAFRC